MSSQLRSRPRSILLACLVVCVGACQHGSSSNDPLEPVAECKEYQALLASCLHRPTDFAEQPTLLPKDENDRQRIRQVCADNLTRLKVACR